ncbi:MAG: DUF3341 domain-containing protein [Candidatus Latescibacteria bacterium]|jgi:hypothetical protein|nr:DUF3341 domain-containing protein [Candidatus Latescibacterota bacterium]MDP7236235.1 DUF3341 domain-containing protein [Candidatus Latescibacterota bacterium]
MDRQYLIGVFDSEEDVIEATRVTRESGYDIYDVYTPYAVHGLPEAMGLKPSRLTWACLLFAFMGFSAAITGQFWISGFNWPINVGGRPFNSLPAYLPVMFECIVLGGGIGVTLTMLFRNKLYPGKKEFLFHQDITNHRFALALERVDSSFDLDSISAIWAHCHVSEIKQVPEVAA